MSYDSEVKRLLKITEDENANTLAVPDLQSINIIPRPEIFRKQVGVITVCKGYSPSTGTTLPNPVGFVNPLVTVMAGIPSLTPPPLIIPVLLDFSPIDEPVLVPNAILNENLNILLVASEDNNTVVPGTEEEANDAEITVTPSDTNVPVSLTGTPTFYAPGVVSIPLSSTETTVTGANPTLTVTFTNGAGQIGSILTVPLAPSTSVTPPIIAPPVGTNPSALTSSPLGNGLVTPIVGQFPVALTNMQPQMGVPIITPTF